MKLQALASEERRLVVEAAEAAAKWQRAASEADSWSARAAVSCGDRPFSLVAAHTRRPASVEVRWRSWMGMALPAAALVPGDVGPSVLGGSAALDLAAATGLVALEAGVRAAALARELDLIRAERTATTRRQRALERRWIPLLEDSLARLEQALDELEREDAVRARWRRERTAGRRIAR
jgi:V/A-type H+-transporting ATPase subunit D